MVNIEYITKSEAESRGLLSVLGSDNLIVSGIERAWTKDKKDLDIRRLYVHYLANSTISGEITMFRFGDAVGDIKEVELIDGFNETYLRLNILGQITESEIKDNMLRDYFESASYSKHKALPYLGQAYYVRKLDSEKTCKSIVERVIEEFKFKGKLVKVISNADPNVAIKEFGFYGKYPHLLEK